MTPLSVCIIDDKIPANKFGDNIIDTKLLNASDLRLFLQDDSKWEDAELFDLVKRLFGDSTKWDVSAFTQPQFFLDHIESHQFRPDIIILDWEFGTGEPTEEYLRKILEKSFSIVSIYTHIFKEAKPAIDHVDFDNYRNRIRDINKDAPDSLDSLLKIAEDMHRSNFSFMFGKELRRSTFSALEHILVELGKMPIRDVLRLLCQNDNDKLSEDELIAVIVERIRGSLIEDDNLSELLDEESVAPETREKLFELIVGKLKDEISFDVESILEGEEEGSGGSEDTTSVAKKLWSYRLYHKPVDDVVRRGDIIKRRSDGTDKLYLVVSGNCDLSRFWKKNFGHINLVPLYKMHKDADFAKKINLTHSGTIPLKDFKATSLTNKIDPLPEKGALILPFIEYDGSDDYYILFPKELFSKEISSPSQPSTKRERVSLGNQALTYSSLKKHHFDGEGRIAVSEPFRTPLIEYIMTSITGFGTPDYPEHLQESMKNELKEIFS